MHIKKLRIENFRSIEKLEVEFDTLVSVIIGPNAVGKTTVLEAVRLARALLAARIQNEPNQVLQSLGASTPHMPQRLFPAGLTTKPEQPLSIRSTYRIAPEELSTLKQILPKLVLLMAQQSVGMNFANPAQVAGFFASPLGKQAISQAQTTLNDELSRAEVSMSLNVNLTLDFSASQVVGEFPTQQLFVSALEQELPPHQSGFSYFSADRALPSGEQPVQFGSADANLQLESYNSQPYLKYQRLKNSILGSILRSSNGRAELDADFGRVFGNVLKGRRLGEIVSNEAGLFSIPIKDPDTGKEFDIDGLSSGEKGLILTCLLISRTITRNGLVLLDEPELHLNPAVCRNLLQFIVDQFAEKENIQFLICSHSPEIMAATFERSSCSLFHLRDGNTLAKVRHSDHGEIRDALRRLGSSESEALLYTGSISVEGIHDVEILQAGYDDLLRRHKLKQLGGRGKIEKDIQELQKGEESGEEIGDHFFIFDQDDRATALTPSKHVRFLQLSRFCLENFLLDPEILTDLSRNNDYSDAPQATVTAMRQVMRRLALRQISERAARLVFKDEGLEDIKFDMSAVRHQDGADIANALSTQIETLSGILFDKRRGDFRGKFLVAFEEQKRQLEAEWDEGWKEHCDGKRLLEDMRRDGYLKGDLLRVKKAIMSSMKNKRTETYNSLESSLRNLLQI